MEELVRLRKLAGLMEGESLCESSDVNDFLKDRFRQFLNEMLGSTIDDLDGIISEVQGIEMNSLNESNLAMIADMKQLVNVMADLKKKHTGGKNV